MDSITYKGVEYPIRHLKVLFEEEDSKSHPHSISVSVESLSAELMKDCGEGFENMTPETEGVDSRIYFYVPDEVINLTGEELCNHVDEVVFVSEVF